MSVVNVGGSMTSTLVETVSINYEDFNDSFLTCGTCLCMYDNQEHTPKLLPCSHTVCKNCLFRICEAQTLDTGTFRCPICRETIPIPRGGVGSFPPSFIVNQLLDLMASQRRDVIPKCSVHNEQELLFCETCDKVFCNVCSGGEHNGRGASEHTVIPFSIAIKRMSEILLYKASLCIKNLNSASDNVNDELRKLEYNVEKTLDTANRSFEELISMMQNRRHDVLQRIRKVRDEKRKGLMEQLNMIQAEKTKVQSECNGLQYQVEVRNITKKISDLNEKLDSTSTLGEPRENAFIKYEYKHNTALKDIVKGLGQYGRIKISTTFPALSTAKVGKSVTHIKNTVLVNTVDLHGSPRTTGGDPVVSILKTEQGQNVETKIKDNEDGTYAITFTTTTAGRHKLVVSIFDRPIKESPFLIESSTHNNPVLKYGTRGSGSCHFTQPVGVCVDKENNIYVLDTGNSRIKVLKEDGTLIGHVNSVGLQNQSGTGIAMTPRDTIVVVNWRTKFITEMNLDGEMVNKFTSPELVEPIDVAVNSAGEIIIADNGAGRLFMFDSEGRMINKIASKGDKQGQLKLITSVTIGKHDEILVTDHRIQIFNKTGKFLQEIVNESKTKVKGQYGGVTVDSSGYILATQSEKGKSVIQVFSPNRKLLFAIDSIDDKLRRPSGLACTSDHHVVVVDLGNDCIKKFRYR
ncbi:unnamed protein product [Owenia fusiformis]|uniref:Tripartite motif-containing protein 2-like n=1 Tax=Owenia fusiformis TaxID=6347 RepID=A0A8S4MUE0_OWEFU|nr:unnamed protein product [Owenia fusiformis]